MPTLRDLGAALIGALAYAAVFTLTRQHGVPLTAIGRAKARGEKAFVLSVTLDFQDEATANGLVEAWREAADWCFLNENFLYACNAAMSRNPRFALSPTLCASLTSTYSRAHALTFQTRLPRATRTRFTTPSSNAIDPRKTMWGPTEAVLPFTNSDQR